MAEWSEKSAGIPPVPVLDISVPRREEPKKTKGDYYDALLPWKNPNNETQSENEKQEIDGRLTITEKKVLATLQYRAELVQSAIEKHKKTKSNPKRWNITISSEWNWVYSTNSYNTGTAFRIIEQNKTQGNIKFEIVYPNNSWFWSTLNTKSTGEVVGITNFVNSAKYFIQSDFDIIKQKSITSGPFEPFNEEGGDIICRVTNIGSLDGKHTILSAEGATLIWLPEVDVKKIVDYLNYLYKEELGNQKIASLPPKQ